MNKPSPNKISTETKNNQPLKNESLTEKQKQNPSQTQKYHNQLDIRYRILSKKVTPQVPLVSKTALKFPWNNNPLFLRAQSINHTPKLISSFRITLPEPFMSERINIALAANKLKGAVVQPGQVFSLNKRIGKRTAPKGFKMGPMILNKKKSKSIGGGVCKIATVMYNAAVLGNQRIVERHPHTKKSPYIRMGQDATLSYGSKDLKFQNTTANPILIWSQSINDTLYIALYGDYTPPKITWKHQVTKKKGVKVVHSWITMKKGQGRVSKDMGVSRYYLKK